MEKVKISKHANWNLVPAHTKQSIQLYVEKRIPPGGFLLAVLTNDLKGAVGRADEKNRRALPDIVKFLYNYIPARIWGDEKAVKQHLEENSKSR